MAKRDVVGRYRGSLFGVVWSMLNPLLMLAVYTFVFSVVFNSKWAIESEARQSPFVILLFVGIIVHGLFAECVNRAPSLVLSNPNYVKKVVFPLEILVWVALGSALFHAAVSIVVLLVAQLGLGHPFYWTAFLLPLTLLPLVLFTVGLGWILAALGVFVRDIGQVTTFFTTIMMFVSPVFYPLSALPARYQRLLALNPLAEAIEDSRSVLIFGALPDMHRWLAMLIAGLLTSWLGFVWFQKSRKGFADVV